MNEAAQRIAAASRRWRRRRLSVAGLWVAAVVLPWVAGVPTAALLGARVVAALVGAGGLVVGIWAWRRRRPAAIDAAAMARHLDRRRPELEESSELMLKSDAELSLLGRLQRERIARRLPDAESKLEPPRLGRAVAGLAVSLVVALLVPLVAARAVEAYGKRVVEVERRAAAAPASRQSPALRAVAVRIVPPGYTGLPERTVDSLDLSAEAGAQVEWRVEVTGDVVAADLVFDERETVALALGEDGVFTAGREALETHLYRVELTATDGEVVGGGYARFEVIPDRPPEFTIVRPERFVELAGERGQEVEIVVEALDDYGLGPAALVATVASGFGELVEFRERRLVFDRREELAGGGRRYVSLIDLDALGVVPGSEFFFFAEGKDRRRPRPQSGRSATHIVRLPGDAMRSIGMASRLPILRVPEFFRSQRQIILDTERLLADEPAITEAEFRRRSEGLGFDQRALRQRYGGLLGEEFDSGRPVRSGEGTDEEHAEETRRLDEMEPGRGGGRGGIREALETLAQGLAHQHDSAEISTYFDSEIKAQLKAALEEMWGSEGRLRSIDPRRALPFEYRALTLLKQVQQRSRLYVQKIGFEAPVLYPEEKRLTGDLTKIRDLRRQGAARRSEELAGVRLALAALDSLGTEVESSELLAGALAAARRLAARARQDPDLELAGLESLRSWITNLEQGRVTSPEVAAGASAALWSLLPTPEAVPAVPRAGATDLGTNYRRRLAGEGSR